MHTKTASSLQQAHIELMQQITPFMRENNGYKLYCAENKETAEEWASRMLGAMINRHSLLLMFYDPTLHTFYNNFAGLNTIEPLAIMLAEEVFGEPFHLESYEHSLKKLGFIDAISKRGVPFFRILSRTPTIGSTLRLYRQHLATMLASAEHTHIIVEVSGDGGLGGIPPANNRGCGHLFDDNSPLFGDYFMDYSMPLEGSDYPDKITATYRVFDEASHIWAFGFGENAGDVIRSILSDDAATYADTPACRLREYRHKLHLFTDQSFL